MGAMTFEQFLAMAGSATSVLAGVAYLNYRGLLLWRAQVDREIAAIVSGYEKLLAAKAEVAEGERADKNEWKSVAYSLMPGLQAAVKGVVEVAKKVGT